MTFREKSNLDRIWPLIPITLFIMVFAGSLIVAAFAPGEYRIYLIIVPFVLILGIVAFLRPEIALLLSIAYIPFESTSFNLFNLPGGLSVSKVLGGMLLSALIFNILFEKRSFRFMDDTEDFAVLLLAVALIFSGVASEYPSQSFQATSRMLRLFAFYFAVKNLATSLPVLKHIMWVMLLSVTAASWWGINTFLANRTVRINDIRVGGAMMNPNDFALLAIIALMVGLYLFPITHRIHLKALIGLCLASIVSAIFLTGSRGGLLTLTIVSGIYIWNHPRRLQLFIGVGILLLVTFPIWPKSITARIGLEESGSSSVISESAEFSAQRRLSYILFSSDLIVSDPISGIGYRTFANYFPRSEFVQYDNPLKDEGFERVAHNAYLEIGVGTGLIGLVVYLIFLLVTGRDFFWSSRMTERGTIGWSVSNGFLLGLVAFVIGSTFLSVEHFNYLWMMGGIASALRHYLSTHPEQTIFEKNEILSLT